MKTGDRVRQRGDRTRTIGVIRKELPDGLWAEFPCTCDRGHAHHGVALRAAELIEATAEDLVHVFQKRDRL